MGPRLRLLYRFFFMFLRRLFALVSALGLSLVCGLFLGLPGAVQAADPAFKLELSGLEGELKSNVDAQLAAVNSSSITVQSRYRAQVRSAVREGLRSLGYYRPTLKFKWQKKPKSGPRVLTLQVTPGDPVRIEEVRIHITGDAKDDRDFERLIRRGTPKKGDVLNHGTYDKFKSDLNNLAMTKGYFQAKFLKSQLQVSPEHGIAFWVIDYDAGPRYKFGKVTFHGSQIDDVNLQNLVPFDPGAPFSSDDLAKLNERLSATGWFNSVVVAPEFRNATAENELPLYGHVVPRSGNSVELGLGFSIDVGPRFRADWKKPWVNEHGHSLESSTNLSSADQELDFAYKVPREERPLEEYYLFQGGYKHTDLNDTKSDSMTLVASRYWELETGWQRSINLRWMLDKFTQGSVDNTTMLIYPGVTLSRTRSRGGMMPRWGDSQRYTLDVASTFWGSDIDFVAFSAAGTIIRTYGGKHRFIGRGNFGWIETNDFDQVPPDLRFFAGGDRSVRGYDYKSISPEDEDGDLMGAERLITASLEYQYNVTGKWWGAVFYDVGEAVKKFTSTNFKSGAGFGIRWESPIGPVKLDIARPVGDPDANGIAFYIGLGSEL